MTALLITIIAQSPINKDYLSAVAWVESRNDPMAQGTNGERGLFQICESTWTDMTNLPFDLAYDASENRKVAARYFDWIYHTLKTWNRNKEPTVRELLACYNGGIGRFRKCGFAIDKMPLSTQLYIERVMIKYEQEKKKANLQINRVGLKDLVRN